MPSFGGVGSVGGRELAKRVQEDAGVADKRSVCRSCSLGDDFGHDQGGFAFLREKPQDVRGGEKKSCLWYPFS